MKTVGNSSRGRSQGVPKIFRAPMYMAHCAVIFAIAQLSCLVSLLHFAIFSPVVAFLSHISLALLLRIKSMIVCRLLWSRSRDAEKQRSAERNEDVKIDRSNRPELVVVAARRHHRRPLTILLPGVHPCILVRDHRPFV